MKTEKAISGPVVRATIDDMQVCSIDEGARTATFTAITEGAIQTWGGTMHLRMSGARLSRFRKNPVVLDSHDRGSIGAIIGRAEVKVEGRKMTAAVTFAKTDRAETAWQLYRDKFLNALSIGFMPNHEKTLQLEDGKTDGEGDGQISGPALIVREWELLEISLVTVPADRDALRMAFDGAGLTEEQQATFLSLLNGLGQQERGPADNHLNEKEKDMTIEKKEEAASNAETAKGKEPVIATLSAEEKTIQLSAAIKAICPAGMETLSAQLILDGVSLDEAKAKFKAALAEKSAAVGTPEPPPAKPAEGLKFSTIPDSAVVAALMG